MSLDDTRTATQSLHPADAAPRPGVLLIDHPDPRFVGISRVIADGESIVLGRGSEALIPGVFVDGRISRRHATRKETDYPSCADCLPRKIRLLNPIRWPREVIGI